jgi:hypothetical protein
MKDEDIKTMLRHSDYLYEERPDTWITVAKRILRVVGVTAALVLLLALLL